MMDFNSHPRIGKISKTETNVCAEDNSHGLIVCDSLSTCDSPRPDFRNKTMNAEI